MGFPFQGLPFAMAELVARVEARLRGAPPRSAAREAYRFGDVVVDFSTRR